MGLMTCMTRYGALQEEVRYLIYYIYTDLKDETVVAIPGRDS